MPQAREPRTILDIVTCGAVFPVSPSAFSPPALGLGSSPCTRLDSTRLNRRHYYEDLIAASVQSSSQVIFPVRNEANFTRVSEEDITFHMHRRDDVCVMKPTKVLDPSRMHAEHKTPFASPALVATPSNSVLRGLEVCAGVCWIAMHARPALRGTVLKVSQSYW